MPTLPVTKPFSYEKWECDTLRWLDFKVVPMDPSRMDDCASMGRTWYLDAMASLVMGDKERLLKSTRLVCAAGVRDNGYWRERYLPQPDGTIRPAKAEKYCEYPAVLSRIVLGNRELFF